MWLFCSIFALLEKKTWIVWVNVQFKSYNNLIEIRCWLIMKLRFLLVTTEVLCGIKCLIFRRCLSTRGRCWSNIDDMESGGGITSTHHPCGWMCWEGSGFSVNELHYQLRSNWTVLLMFDDVSGVAVTVLNLSLSLVGGTFFLGLTNLTHCLLTEADQQLHLLFLKHVTAFSKFTLTLLRVKRELHFINLLLFSLFLG